jgi:hypothetical protein
MSILKRREKMKTVSKAYNFKGFKIGRVMENKRGGGKYWGKVGKAGPCYTYPKEIIDKLNEKMDEEYKKGQ